LKDLKVQPQTCRMVSVDLLLSIAL